MAYSLKKPYNNFTDSAIKLNNIVIKSSTNSDSLEKEALIEGCFIRLVTSWEVFIEEYFLRCMCVAETRSGKTIKPRGGSYPSLTKAFERINKNRKPREKDYIDWLDTNLLKERANDFFRKNSRVSGIIAISGMSFQIVTIRNAIAHRSPSSIRKFKDYVRDQFGHITSLNPTMSSLLTQNKRGTNTLLFSIIVKHLTVLSDNLTK